MKVGAATERACSKARRSGGVKQGVFMKIFEKHLATTSSKAVPSDYAIFHGVRRRFFSVFSVSVIALLAFNTPVAAETSSEPAATKPKRVNQVGQFYQPNNVEPGIYTFDLGDDIVSQPTLWGISPKLDRRQSIATSDGQLFIEAEAVLPGVLVSGLPESDGDELVFCTAAKNKAPAPTMGLLGVLGTKIIDSLTDGQRCVWDKDNDGNADHAFLLNKGSRSDRTPSKIESIPLNVVELREVGPGNGVYISLSERKAPEFTIEIYQQGEEQIFDFIKKGNGSIPKVLRLKKNQIYPVDLEIYGANFQVISFDEKSKQITIQFDERYSDLLVNVPTETVVRYRYY